VQSSVQYDLIVHVSRSKFRIDSKVQTMIAYVPITRPGPPSPLRQLAYQENSPLLGPEADPEGWEQLRPFTVTGIVFNKREVEIACVLSLAKPLCYTRGTPIPCIMTLASTDIQALDLLSASRALTVLLRRCVTGRNPSVVLPPVKRKMAEAAIWKDDLKDVAVAKWWPSSEGSPPEEGEEMQIQRAGEKEAKTRIKRTLDGEIQLPKTLSPSCFIAHFSVQYSILVLPFKATAFISASTEPLLEHRIEIATMHARGVPRPRTYSPPDYLPPPVAPPGVQ